MGRISNERCIFNEREKPWGLFLGLKARSRSHFPYLPSHPICLQSSDNFMAGQHRPSFRWISQSLLSNLLSSPSHHIHLKSVTHWDALARTPTHTHTKKIKVHQHNNRICRCTMHLWLSSQTEREGGHQTEISHTAERVIVCVVGDKWGNGEAERLGT